MSRHPDQTHSHTHTNAARRRLALTALGSILVPSVTWAHHGWSSFDIEQPVYLEGKVTKSTWKNPHAELIVTIPTGMKVPPDLASRNVPGQSANLDAKAILSKAAVPKRQAKTWELELAPLTRMELWQVAEIKVGATVAVVGYALKAGIAEAVVRVEYLWVDGKVYALRSSPA